MSKKALCAIRFNKKGDIIRVQILNDKTEDEIKNRVKKINQESGYEEYHFSSDELLIKVAAMKLDELESYKNIAQDYLFELERINSSISDMTSQIHRLIKKDNEL